MKYRLVDKFGLTIKDNFKNAGEMWKFINEHGLVVNEELLPSYENWNPEVYEVRLAK